ncbi:MAG: helix-turn-helix domain-containing protein [Azospirillum sp.]|nr:helix-turn-helix domain-containing protein [Azospirillum sp.]
MDTDDAIARAANAKKGSPFLNTAQAAFYVDLSRRTLEKMRVVGGGPKFRKHGRFVRYHVDDLDAWSASRGKASTSDPGPKTDKKPARPRPSGRGRRP